jgi:integrase
MKIDPYKHKERYLNWKESVKDKIPDISDANSDLIYNYIIDMENGLNVSTVSQKGARSYTRLNNLRQRLIFLAKAFEKEFRITDMSKLTEEVIFKFFGGMRNGTIKRADGKEYLSVIDFVKNFKSFWHWHVKVNRKRGIEVPDITLDLDTSKQKPKWVYLTEEQTKRLCDNVKFEYKVLIMFLFDTGARAPTELINIRVSDLYNDCKEVHIREEISKTFGRRVKLMICSELIKEHIRVNNLKESDQLFNIKPSSVNKYLQRQSKNLFGEDKSPAGKKYSELTMYHFRHCSCCYWLPRYKSESALKYRFGWKKSDKIHYYSELLGMRDTISEEDMLVDVTKTEIEQRLLKSENEKTLLQERIDTLENQMRNVLGLIEKGELVPWRD